MASGPFWDRTQRGQRGMHTNGKAASPLCQSYFIVFRKYTQESQSGLVYMPVSRIRTRLYTWQACLVERFSLRLASLFIFCIEITPRPVLRCLSCGNVLLYLEHKARLRLNRDGLTRLEQEGVTAAQREEYLRLQLQLADSCLHEVTFTPQQ